MGEELILFCRKLENIHFHATLTDVKLQRVPTPSTLVVESQPEVTTSVSTGTSLGGNSEPPPKKRKQKGGKGRKNKQAQQQEQQQEQAPKISEIPTNVEIPTFEFSESNLLYSVVIALPEDMRAKRNMVGTVMKGKTWISFLGLTFSQ